MPTCRACFAAALAPFAVSRGLLLLWVGLGLWWVPPAAGWRTFPDVPWLDGWARWDAGWYCSVFVQGYTYMPGVECNANFFPLMPYMAGLCSLPLRLFLAPDRAFMAAAVALDHVLFLVGLAGLFRLGAGTVGRVVATRSLWLLCLFPFSFFFSAAYSESVYFALLTWSFALAADERWGWAGFLAGLSILSRPHGAISASALALQYASTRGFDVRRLDRAALGLLWVPVGVAALLLIFQAAVGEPLVFLRTRTVWRVLPSFYSLYFDVRTVLWRHALGVGVANLVVLVGVLASVVPVTRRYGVAYGWLTLMTIAVPAVSGLESLGRYASTAFPMFWLAATLLHDRRALAVALALSTGLLLVFSYMFAHWARIT